MISQNKWDTLIKLYINRGLKIIPLRANSKLPAIEKWNEQCSSNAMQCLYWFENNHNMNWGLPCIENNLFVLDLDTHKIEENGIDNFKKLCNDLGIEEPCTLKQRTKSGGIHLIFQSDDELKQVCGTANAFKDYPGIDLRNSNYIVVEPSVIDNVPYTFLNNMEPQTMPQKLKDYILNNAEKKSKEKKPYVKPKETVLTGNRDDQLFAYITNLYYKTRLDIDEISILAHNFNETMLDDPLSSKDVDYKVKKAFQKDRTKCLFIMLPDE